jgi:hypothetical protein
MKTLATLLSMSIFVVATIVLVATAVANADVHVRGYYRNNGTYVQPHYRSNPDGNRSNNWSTYPNVNPHTGKVGTKRISALGGSNVTFQNRVDCVPSPSLGNVYGRVLRNPPTTLPYNPYANSVRASSFGN